jgi:hypothetical protein
MLSRNFEQGAEIKRIIGKILDREAFHYYTTGRNYFNFYPHKMRIFRYKVPSSNG